MKLWEQNWCDFKAASSPGAGIAQAQWAWGIVGTPGDEADFKA